MTCERVARSFVVLLMLVTYVLNLVKPNEIVLETKSLFEEGKGKGKGKGVTVDR